MYCNFFGFSEKPFDTKHDPGFLYRSLGYRKNIASLISGILRWNGLIIIIGEEGTGKTTLLDTALGRLDENTKVACILNPDSSFEQMLDMALVDLGLARADGLLYKQQGLDRLKRFAAAQLGDGGNVVFIVDEAHNLHSSTIENLRLLYDLESQRQRLVQFVLCGQPELETKLCLPELQPLAQGINLRLFVNPLNQEETYQYVKHRLGVANYQGEQLFSSRALRLIWEYSGGVPRRINVVCDNALLIGYGKGKKRIVLPEIEEAIEDLSWKPFSGTFEPLPGIPIEENHPQEETKSSYLLLTLFAGLGLLVCLILGILFFSGASGTNLQVDETLPPLNEVRGKITSKPGWPSKSPGLFHPDPPALPHIGQQVIVSDDTMTSAPAHVRESNTDHKQAGYLVIQLGAFRNKIKADDLMKRLLEKGYEPYMEAKKVKNTEPYYRVRLRGYTAMAQVRKERTQLTKQGFRDSFIVRPDKD